MSFSNLKLECPFTFHVSFGHLHSIRNSPIKCIGMHSMPPVLRLSLMSLWLTVLTNAIISSVREGTVFGHFYLSVRRNPPAPYPRPVKSCSLGKQDIGLCLKYLSKETISYHLFRANQRKGRELYYIVWFAVEYFKSRLDKLEHY